MSFCVNSFKTFIIAGKFSTSNYEVLWSILLSFTSCGIPFTYILALLKLLQSSLMHNKFFPQSLHFYFTCLYLTYSIFFSFMNIRIIDVVSILMSFPDNYVIYILLVFLPRFFSRCGHFLASLHIWIFFFLFKFIYLS